MDRFPAAQKIIMKHLGIFTTWAVAIAMSLCLRGAGKLMADPTDDFSFTLAHAPELEVYRLMPEQRIVEIFQDSLDLFPRSETPKLARHLISLCKQYRFDPAFVLSLIQVESAFKIKIVSDHGAVGLMQIMPGTAVKMAHELGIDLTSARFGGRRQSEYATAERMLKDPFANLTLGVAYLAWLRDHYSGQAPYYLVAAYNVGPARMDELLSRKDFKPVITKKYFDAIRRGVPGLRFYRHEAAVEAAARKRHRRPSIKPVDKTLLADLKV